MGGWKIKKYHLDSFDGLEVHRVIHLSKAI
jgi:hypothetical protein